VAGVTAAAFLPVLRNGFVNWDDPANIVDNPHFRGFDVARLRWMFTTFHMGHYHPLSWLSLAADHSLWGMNPAGYHLTSLLLHSANAALFYFLALGLLRLAIPAAAQGLRLQTCAALAALLFSLHPLRVESVAWASERRDVLSAFFYLGSILLYLRAQTSPARWRRTALIASWTAFACSLLSKAVGIGLPVTLLCLDLAVLERRDRESWRGILLEKVPFAGLGAGVALLALFASSKSTVILSLAAQSPSARLAQTFYGLAFYLCKSVWPTGLAAIYARPSDLSILTWPYSGAAAFVFAVSVLATFMRRRVPALAASWVHYVTVLLPLSGLFTAGPQVAADRYSYLSCLGWPLLAAGGALAACRRQGWGGKWLAAILAAACLGLGLATWRQTGMWRDSLTLWRAAYPLNRSNTLVQSNLALTYYNLGVDEEASGRLADAAGRYTEALAVYPGLWQAHQNLGNLLLARRDAASALWHFGLAVQLSAQSPAPVAGYLRALQACGLWSADRGTAPPVLNLEGARARCAPKRH
jgi:tetratricopeptide (TPR) repeat protein